MCEERRRGIDPATAMLAEYERYGQEEMNERNYGNKARSPSQREKTRLKAANQSSRDSELGASSSGNKYEEKMDVRNYLNKFSVEDLGRIIRDRKSTKKLLSPAIGGKKTGWGEMKCMNSVPRHVLDDKGHEYGVSSYHKGSHQDLKDVLGNQFVKESMID